MMSQSVLNLMAARWIALVDGNPSHSGLGGSNREPGNEQCVELAALAESHSAGDPLDVDGLQSREA